MYNASWLTPAGCEPRGHRLASLQAGCLQEVHLLAVLGDMSTPLCLHLPSAIFSTRLTAAFSISLDSSGQVHRDVIRAFANATGLHRRIMISLGKIPA